MLQKRFVNEDECIGYYTGKKEKFSEMSPILSGSDFKGPNLDHQMGGFGAQFPYNNNNLTTGVNKLLLLFSKNFSFAVGILLGLI